MSKPNYLMRGMLAVSLATVVTLVLAEMPGDGRSYAYGEDREEAAKLYGKGEIVGLETVIEKARAAHPGRVLEAELEAEHGRRYYEVEILGEDGVVWELKFDAASGDLIGKERDD